MEKQTREASHVSNAEKPSVGQAVVMMKIHGPARRGCYLWYYKSNQYHTLAVMYVNTRCYRCDKAYITTRTAPLCNTCARS